MKRQALRVIKKIQGIYLSGRTNLTLQVSAWQNSTGMNI